VFRTIFSRRVVVSLVAWTDRVELPVAGQRRHSTRCCTWSASTARNWLRGDTDRAGVGHRRPGDQERRPEHGAVLAALQGVPRPLLEGREIDGAGPWRRFRSIVFPMISPTTLLAAIVTVSGSLQVFAQIQILTAAARPTAPTLARLLLLPAGVPEPRLRLRPARWPWCCSWIILALTLAQWRLRRRWVFHES